MRESGLIKKINDRLPKSIHHQSMTGASLTHNGVTDQYYDGTNTDMWIEYKQLTAMPRSGMVGGVDNKKQGKYRTLQFKWMRRRYENCIAAGVVPNVFGVIGLPNGRAVIQTLPRQWEHGCEISGALTIKEIADWITDFSGP